MYTVLIRSLAWNLPGDEKKVIQDSVRLITLQQFRPGSLQLFKRGICFEGNRAICLDTAKGWAVWMNIHDYLFVAIIALLDQFNCLG